MNKIYSRLAFTNIKNNKTLYMPYIISGMVMIAMFYVMMFLNNSKGLGKVPGADALASIMGLGCGTIAVFSYIFLFYTNSFIIKRRKKEVGIYNILGMEKRHIARVLIIETLTVALAAIVSGIIAGILFSKLMIMFLYRIINIKAQIDFAVSTGAVVNTILIFGVLYFLTLIYNLMQVKLANPIELLRGGNVGEKEPKSKWLIAIIGLGCLAGGYYIAITTKSPLQVLSLFFVAVLLVIVGTYLLFISGSIVILKALRKNKKFYYNKKHFAAVSGMIYRMKQNAGVSNIEITDSNIKAFESTAKKYNIDFSLKKVKGEQTRYLVFFKGRDADVMTAAFQEFSAKKLNREKKPSIRKALAAAKDKAKQLNAARDKVKKMDRGREI